MTTPRLEIDLGKVRHNATMLVERLAGRGIAVTGVTKATLGAPELARELLAAGVSRLGDSHIEGIEGLRRAGVSAPMTLLRTPMISQVKRVVAHADVSLNTERATLEALSVAAGEQGTSHGVVLMVELGDLREGIMATDLVDAARMVVGLPSLELVGIGTNLACQSGVVPDVANMAELSVLAETAEAALGVRLAVVSGGNSANLGWALGGGDPGRVNDLRLGEAILLGCEPLHRQPVEGLRTDAFVLVAEVIESKIKPSQPWGQLGQTAFGDKPRSADRGLICQVILAVGRQDTDTAGLVAPAGITILGASSDHLVVESADGLRDVGSELAFGLDYSSLARAMSSPYVARVWLAPDREGSTTVR
ncbi:MAG: alanine/ornithine racemase family PLP-dependent enzyme [Acidimicrobiia bacterium]|nr:alanine/ornithine racemase family PLP-dependent enzyme [Acidimicrobiia bacterium]